MQKNEDGALNAKIYEVFKNAGLLDGIFAPKFEVCDFEETEGKDSVVNRTEHIFYVCCSRAMDNLVVFYPSPTSATIVKAKEMFGEANVVAI